MQQHSFRSVHFDEKVLRQNSSVSSAEIRDAYLVCSDTKEVWWSKEELDSFQNHLSLLVSEISKRERNGGGKKGFQNLLISVYIRCDDIDGPTLEQRHYLRQWVKSAMSRRGIENLCSIELAEARRERRLKTIQAVLAAQQCSSYMSIDERCSFIRSISECRSFSARAFASLMGECDAYATSADSIKSERMAEQKVLSRFPDGESNKESMKLSRFQERSHKKYKRLNIVGLVFPGKQVKK